MIGENAFRKFKMTEWKRTVSERTQTQMSITCLFYDTIIPISSVGTIVKR